MEIVTALCGCLLLLGSALPAQQEPASSTRPDSDSTGYAAELVQQTRLEELIERGLDQEEIDSGDKDTAVQSVNLNRASREELESIPFFTPEDAENTAYYVYRYGPVKSIRELLLIENMDEAKLEQIRPYVCISEPDSAEDRQLWHLKDAGTGKHELRTTYHQTLEKKDGFRSNIPESARFGGDCTGVAVRYGYNSGNHLLAGFVVEKDPGERWWNRGPDFSSFHIQIKNTGKIKTVVAGDYNVRFAEGLVCGNMFSLGKSATGSSPEQTGATLSRHFSASEYNFLRGLAGTVVLNEGTLNPSGARSVELTGYVSSRHPDADTTAGRYETESTSGLHRTRNELAGKNSLHQLSAGIQVQFRYPVALFSIQSCGWSTNIRNTTRIQEVPLKSRGLNTSVGFKARFRQLRLFGEFAVDGNLNTACLAGCRIKPDKNITLQMLGRAYAPGYNAAFANGLSEGGGPKNEKGLFASIQSLFFRKINTVFTYDFYHFPTATYYTATASGGHEESVFISGYSGKNGEWSMRFRTETKDKNANFDKNPLHLLSKEKKSQVRLQCIEKRKNWQCRTLFDTNWYAFEGIRKQGYAFAVELSLGDPAKKWSATLHASLFNADNWENRIYIWEKSMPGSFSMPMLYGRGYRNGLFLERSLKHFQLRLSLSKQTQPEVYELGSSGDRIAGNSRTDLRLQITYRLRSAHNNKSNTFVKNEKPWQQSFLTK